MAGDANGCSCERPAVVANSTLDCHDDGVFASCVRVVSVDLDVVAVNFVLFIIEQAVSLGLLRSVAVSTSWLCVNVTVYSRGDGRIILLRKYRLRCAAVRKWKGSRLACCPETLQRLSGEFAFVTLFGRLSRYVCATVATPGQRVTCFAPAEQRVQDSRVVSVRLSAWRPRVARLDPGHSGREMPGQRRQKLRAIGETASRPGDGKVQKIARLVSRSTHRIIVHLRRGCGYC